MAQTPGSEQVLRALADSTRQRLLQLLLVEELNVTELVEILRLPQSTISRHLRMLHDAGLVHDRRDGTTALYSATQTPANGDNLPPLLLEWLRQRSLPKPLQNRLHRVLRKRQDEAVRFFERLGNRWDELRTEAFGEAFASEAFLTLLPRDWTVADIGTGTGYLLPSLAEHFRRVIAVEPAPAMLECARQRVTDHGAKNVTYHHGDLGSLPIRDRACDLAVACLVLHHVPEPDGALGEIHRILRPSGRILIVEQRIHENQAFHEMMQDRWWGFDPADLVRRMSAVGFRRVRQHELTCARDQSTLTEVPGLFAVTGERPDSS